jgi:uncharacterized membrane protein required for colicin V production
MQTFTPIKTGAFLTQGKRLQELTKIRSASITLLKFKKDRLKLEKKYQETKDKFSTRQTILDREKNQEAKKKKPRESKLIRKGQDVASTTIINLLMTFIKLKALMWLGDPENLKKVQAIVKGLSGVFKFIDWFATGSVNNLLNGVHSLVFGGSILERILGLFSAIVGFFGLRYLLNPLKLIKDLKFVIKNGDKIGEIFNAFKKSGIKEGAANLAQGLTKTTSIFKRGLAKGLVRAVLKVFGKGGFKFLAKAAAPAVGGILKLVGGPLKAIASKTVAGIPVVGPLLNLGINLLLGDPIDKAIVKTVGSTLGMGLGAVVGSVFPGPGTIVGGALGGIVGDWAASNLYDWMKSAVSKKEEPALAVGGIVTKPTRALIGEAGPEAVIPLGHIYNGGILSAPFGIIASSMIGGIDALINSMGPVGIAIRPFAQQLLSPYTREFGKTNYAFTSDLAKKSGKSPSILASSVPESTDKELNKIIGSDLPLNIIQRKEQEKKERYNNGSSVREILADILNNFINLDFSSGDTGGGAGGGGGGGAGSDQSLTAAELDAIKASSSDKRAAAHLATLEATAPQHVADVYQVILNRAAGQSGGIPAVITAKEQFTPYSAALYGSSADKNAQRKYGGLGLTKKELFELAGKTDGIQQLTNRFQAGNPKIAAQVIADFEKNGPLSQSAKKFVGGAQYFLGYKHTGARSRPDGGNWFRDKYQTGGIVSTQGVADTGPGYTIQGASDQQGRPVVFSQSAASAFAKMMKDSGGAVKPSDVASSKRSPTKNRSVNGAAKSKHLYGIAMDIHGSSEKWIRANGSKYGWIANDYPGSHGGHFEFGGQGIQPSDSPSQTQESRTAETSTPSWTDIGPQLKQLAELLLPSAPKVNSEQLSSSSMDFVQASKLPVALSDTYIIPQGNTMISNLNVVTPLERTDYSVGSFAHIDSSSYLGQRRL